MTNYVAYIALGDSMSIDLYPALDLAKPATAPVGAASLFFASLKKKHPNLLFENLCVDGHTTHDLLANDALNEVSRYREKPVLITLTIVGNDLLVTIREVRVDLTKEVGEILERLEAVVFKITERFPLATIILNSIYDPSDNSGIMPKMPNFADRLPFLRYLNFEIAKLASENNLLFADVYSRFHGHGHGKSDSYYWESSPIEPSAKGAEALCDLWIETLKNAR